jgi:hypothetical protein
MDNKNRLPWQLEWQFAVGPIFNPGLDNFLDFAKKGRNRSITTRKPWIQTGGAFYDLFGVVGEYIMDKPENVSRQDPNFLFVGDPHVTDFEDTTREIKGRSQRGQDPLDLGFRVVRIMPNDPNQAADALNKYFDTTPRRYKTSKIVIGWGPRVKRTHDDPLGFELVSHSTPASITD